MTRGGTSRSGKGPAGRRVGGREAPADAGSTPTRSLQIAPAALLLILAAPVLLWPFLWDDFEFLNRTAFFQLRDLLPQSGAALYRPLSQVVYFAVVGRLGPAASLAAHLLNATLAAGCVILLASLLRRRAGARAAGLGALLFASTAGLPTLIGWASGCQDLLCILFLLASFNLADRGRSGMALLAFAAALLSKETAVVLAPALLLLHRPAEGAAARPFAPRAIALAAVVGAWALVHPWTRRALHLEGHAPPAGYVGFQGADALRFGLRGLLNIANLTWSPQLDWRPGVIAAGVLAALLTLAALARLWRQPVGLEPAPTRGVEPAYWLAATLTLAGPFVLTAAFIGHWAPYYACLPAAGLAMLVGPLLARHGPRVAAAVCVPFLLLGVVSRLSLVDPGIDAESNMRVTASALNRVERGFKALRPTLPPAARVYVYVQAAGRHGIYASLYRDPPLRVWYGDPLIELLDPMRLAHGSPDDLLFWVGPDLDVFEVNVTTLRVRTSGARVPFDDYQKTLRAYAMGLAGDGQIDRAVTILTTMPQYSEALRAMDRRSAAMLLYASGRREEADRLASGTMRFRRPDALDIVEGLVAKPVGTLDLGPAALTAFDFDPGDTAAVREVMRWLAARHYDESAAQFARRLAAMAPGDRDAERILNERR